MRFPGVGTGLYTALDQNEFGWILFYNNSQEGLWLRIVLTEQFALRISTRKQGDNILFVVYNCNTDIAAGISLKPGHA